MAQTRVKMKILLTDWAMTMKKLQAVTAEAKRAAAAIRDMNRALRERRR
jgi:type IV secretory pathway TrbL component